MPGKATEYFDLWEADREFAGTAKSYEGLLGKVKDYSRRRKLDSSGKAKIQHAGDPVRVGAIGGWSWHDDVGGGCDHERVYKSNGTCKGGCYNRGSPGNLSKECPYQQRGNSKGKGFQGECYN